MKLQAGLFDHMVLQQNRAKRSDAVFAGESNASGVIRATVTKKGQVLKGWKRTRVGVAARGRCAGRIRGLPVGGPYNIELTVAHGAGHITERLMVRDVLVGDVWILGGQSNMQGIGLSYRDETKPHAMVRACYLHDAWDVAKDPIHNMTMAIDHVYGGGQVVGDSNAQVAYRKMETRVQGRAVGPGVAFGQAMFRRTGVPQGLIACALGGSALQQWDPAGKPGGGRTLYGAMFRRFQKNGGAVAGVLWYQGCSDASANDVPLYTRRMRRLVAAVRRDFRQPNLPWAIVQIAGVAIPASESEYAGSGQWWHNIQEQQRRLPEKIPHCVVVPAIDLELDDTIHISGRHQGRLGRRLAQAMRVLRGDRRAGKLPLTLHSVETCWDGREQTYELRVRFNNVMGRLQAAGKPAGFAFPDPSSKTALCRVDLNGDTAVLKVATASDVDQLYYGYGLNPYCNITDAADRAVPVMGPIPVALTTTKCPRTTTPLELFPFIERYRVSPVQKFTGRISKVACPHRNEMKQYRKRYLAGTFWDIRPEWKTGTAANKLIFLVSRFRCPEAMKLYLGLGYDGPVKVWLDGTEVFCDPEGLNPMGLDKAMIPLEVSPGAHELMLALVSNRDRAWGMRPRFLRRDISEKRLKQGPQAYPVPFVLG